MKRPWAGLLGALLCLGGCSKGPSPEQTRPSASVPASASSSARPAPSPAASTAPAPWPRDPVCRALRVEGEVLQGDQPLASGGEVDGSEWVTLSKGARLTLKHSSTGRELAVAGPARLRACRRGREQLLLAQGRLEVGSGMGVRPGAEVVVATPVAAVRYADADFGLTLDDKRLEIVLRAG